MISTELIHWYDANKRDLPWRITKDPYSIWLSEIILQQTRVNQGIPYYNNILRNFPTVFDLAAVDDDQFMKFWQGLGYYSRARNLLTAARTVVYEYNGIFPSKYSEIIKLKGVGDYTAAAIASIAFNESVPVVDGNVKRIISRIYGIEVPLNNIEGINQIKNILKEIMVPTNAGVFNQALMEFGAIQCKPVNPNCLDCFLRKSCYAFNHDKVSMLPLVLKKTDLKKRFLYYFIIRNGKYYYIHQRGKNDIYKSLYEFYLLEYAEKQEDVMLLNDFKSKFSSIEVEILEQSIDIKHILSHQQLNVKFIHVELNMDVVNISEIVKVTFDELANYAYPQFIYSYMKKIKLLSE